MTLKNAQPHGVAPGFDKAEAKCYTSLLVIGSMFSLVEASNTDDAPSSDLKSPLIAAHYISQWLASSLRVALSTGGHIGEEQASVTSEEAGL